MLHTFIMGKTMVIGPDAKVPTQSDIIIAMENAAGIPVGATEAMFENDVIDYRHSIGVVTKVQPARLAGGFRVTYDSDGGPADKYVSPMIKAKGMWVQLCGVYRWRNGKLDAVAMMHVRPGTSNAILDEEVVCSKRSL